ncbi:MAG: putative porin [Candidatus Omnitrophica bacterium]|nr:putative porin [Candidatus Omnitrophota bacterium]
MKRKLFMIMGMAGFLAFGLILRGAQASEMDILLQKLVEKNVLTAGEAQQIATETKEEVRKQNAKGTNEMIPSWVQTVKLKGDFRARYQMDKAQHSNIERSRGRIRLRLGVEAKANDKLLVGVGLATGLSDGSTDASRSTNATLEKGFSKKPIALDYAYATYTPFSWASVTAGKMKNPLWEPMDMVWDTDINPEGFAVQLTKTINPQLDVFATGADFILKEISTEDNDPNMAILQAGFKYAVTDFISVKSAISYYSTSNVKGVLMDGTAGTNTTATLAGSTDTGLKYGYDAIFPVTEISFKDPLKAVPYLNQVNIPYLAFFGEYITNPQVITKKNQTGHMFGVKFGTEKPANFGEWKLTYNFTKLEKDAVLDILPDSDRYGGKTGINSHEAILEFALSKNTGLSFDYYRGKKLAPEISAAEAQVYQLDWNVKF